MTRNEFLSALEQYLSPLPYEERRDALNYYEEYLDAAGPDHEAQAIAELGSPAEVARKILEEQGLASDTAAAAPQPSSAPPKKSSSWRMWLGGGLVVLAIAGFFYQGAKATPIAIASSAVPSSSAVSSESLPASSSIQSADSAASDSLSFSLSADMVSDKLSLKLDAGTVVFVTDPDALGVTLQFDGFDAQYLTHSTKKAGTATFSYHVPSRTALPDTSGSILTITVPENVLYEVDIDLAMGDVELGTLSLEELDLTLAAGNILADSLTVENADFDLAAGDVKLGTLSSQKLDLTLALGDCRIDHLSAPELDAEIIAGNCTIGMLYDAQDVSITTTTGKTSLTLEGSASDYFFVTNGHEDTSLNDGKANATRKIALNSTTGSFSVSYAG